ncbi:SHOCT domain-containing protein [Enterococcus faecalis]|uniref:SHOCT domain-containing protein n=1 Tax=Enterococcus faecalis TaxID=1351 RepID=UPI0010D16820|nr:SHOCT domain-containing protein [Enterococcus faecalis]EAE2458038.1 hypothetical protein [Listeria monocytogenes]EAE2458899.1 hypothetical protein [Listeria monocytogenes]HAC6039125.1 hypothetical protein [Listeria monocytogenes]
MDKTITAITELTDQTTIFDGMSQEEVNREIEFSLAQITLKKMLENGFISNSEFDEITQMNQCVFKPKLYEIMPCNR